LCAIDFFLGFWGFQGLIFLAFLSRGAKLKEMSIRTAAATFCDTQKTKQAEKAKLKWTRFLPKRMDISSIDFSSTRGDSTQTSVKAPKHEASPSKANSMFFPISNSIAPRDETDSSAHQIESRSNSSQDLDFIRFEVF
jgi:hypothetical protein